MELDREEDGRFIADWTALPGVISYGATEEEAIRRVLSTLPAGLTPSPDPRKAGGVGLVVVDLDGGELGPRLLDRMARRAAFAPRT
jgi:hypothetical protein